MIHFIELKKFLLNQAEEEWQAIVPKLDENASASINFTRKASASSLKNEFKIKQISTAKARIRAVGLDNLVSNLENIPEKTILDLQEVKTPEWVGFCASSETEEIVGCAFVRNVKSGKKTPPNWDGTIEELNKFNP
jgi:hypothetical protein